MAEIVLKTKLKFKNNIVIIIIKLLSLKFNIFFHKLVKVKINYYN